MDIDERGRWFVVEMPGYPLDTRPTGRIRLLEDTDGDGKPDRSSIFADNLVLPSGVMRWKRGVIVTSVPDVLYLEDTDGDGKADKREVLVTGFARTNPQHMVNTPVFGLDNWIYLAHEGPAEAVIYTELFGDMGRPLTMPAFPDRPPVDEGRQSVRFNPDTGALEATGGWSQYGEAFDPWGRYFGSDNSNHIRMAMLAARYRRRNPEAPLSWGMADISDHGEAAKVFPITERPTFELLTEAGEFTSACSLTPYTGDLFTGEYLRSTFVAEPVHNLVHRDVIEVDGGGFRARRGSEGREFLASTDAWFRPVSFYVGPDGALYVIDYYRKRIEHPEWTSSEFQKNPAEFSLGADRGRIYRIVPDGPAVPYARVDLGSADNTALVNVLSKGTLWWRRTAQRLLIERKAVDQADALVALAKSAGPLGRLHALWTLNGLDLLPDALIVTALDDAEAGVRENALQLADARLSTPGIAAAVLARTKVETDPRVTFQLIATLGSLPGPAAADAQTRLLFEHLDDLWVVRAALTAGSDRAPAYLDRALDPSSGATASDSPTRRGFFHDLGVLMGARGQDQEIARVISRATGWSGTALLRGIGQGLKGHSSTALTSSGGPLLTLAQADDAGLRRAALSLLSRRGLPGGAESDAAIDAASRLAIDAAADADRRADAIRLLGINGAALRRATFEHLVRPREPEAVQIAALNALESLRGDTVGRELLPSWGTLTPGARSALVDLLLADPARQRLLVDAMTRGTVEPWALNFGQKRDLLMNDDPGIRRDARALLEESPAARGEIANRYAAAVEGGGDPARGQQVFARVCAACHHLGGGTDADVGPDLATVRHRPPLSLLVDILSPSQSIAQGYETYLVELTGGRTEAGTLASQSATSITLRQAAKTIPIQRRDIQRLTVVPQSMMPANLDKVITPEQMADLLAYLTHP
jgi:putative membrane-bound dehydrogenase-like protein